MTYFRNNRNDFYLDIAKGIVDGHSVVSKFGQNSDLGTGAYEDIWDCGGTYTYPSDSTAPITHIDSDEIVDTEPIEIQGLDINGILTVQTITLNGTTLVPLTTPLWRVFRLKNVGTSDLVGNTQAVDSGDTICYAQIQSVNNQTLMALYTIPSGYTGYLMQGSNSMVGIINTYNIDIRMTMRQYGGVFQLKRTMGVNSTGDSYVVVDFPIPGKIPQLTDIRVSAISSKSGGVLNSTFEILLIEN